MKKWFTLWEVFNVDEAGYTISWFLKCVDSGCPRQDIQKYINVQGEK